MNALGGDDMIATQLSTVAKAEYQQMEMILATGASNPYLYNWLFTPDALSHPDPSANCRSNSSATGAGKCFDTPDVKNVSDGWEYSAAALVINRMASVSIADDTGYEIEVTKTGLRLGNFKSDPPKIRSEDYTINIGFFEESLKNYWITDATQTSVGPGNISFKTAADAAGLKIFIRVVPPPQEPGADLVMARKAYTLLILQIIKELFPVQRVFVNTPGSTYGFGTKLNTFDRPGYPQTLPFYPSPGAAPQQQIYKGAGEVDYYGYFVQSRYPKDYDDVVDFFDNAIRPTAADISPPGLKKQIQDLFKGSTYDVEKQGTTGPNGESQNDVLVFKRIKEGFLGKGALKVAT